jgi:hypothetical protein
VTASVNSIDVFRSSSSAGAICGVT